MALRETSSLIGECSIGLLAPDESPGVPDTAVIGFLLHQDYWGQGYATEAVHAMLRFIFLDLELACAYAGCLEENIASRRVLEKAGMQFQGTQANFLGCPLDRESLVFHIERTEWMRQNVEPAMEAQAESTPFDAK